MVVVKWGVVASELVKEERGKDSGKEVQLLSLISICCDRLGGGPWLNT